jgi:hypothetical protein
MNAYIAPEVLARKEYDGKVIPVLLILCLANSLSFYGILA